MSTINTNVASLLAQNALAQSNAGLNTSLQRLSTGLQINSGADNPSGLIAVQNFNQENTGLTTALNNASQAGNVVGTAAGGLSEVSSLLTQLQGLVGQAANTGALTSDQVSADQLQVDSILGTINKIANGTTFQGTHLLNGNLAYSTSGVKGSATQNLNISSALLPDSGALTVNVTVIASASHASITSTTATTTSSVTLEVTGKLGSVDLTFASGTSAATIASSINANTNQTGVTASGNSNGLTLTSSGYGSAQFVSVKAVNGNYAFGQTSATGTDAKVNVNGSQASVSGLSVNYDSSGLSLSLDLASGLNSSSTSETFYITGGGANFALGAQVNDASKASIGISDVSTASLGNYTNGYLNTLATGGANALASGNLTTAQSIVNSAIEQVANTQGQIGSFQDYTLGSTVSALNVAFENSSAAESTIQDTNFAAETSNLTRAQILQQSATTVLAQANAAPKEALTLLQNA